jgi:hypothetical protein
MRPFCGFWFYFSLYKKGRKLKHSPRKSATYKAAIMRRIPFCIVAHDHYTEGAMYSYHYLDYKYGEEPEVTFDMKGNVCTKYKYN